MEKDYIKQLINHFCEGTYSSDMEQKVQRWLVNEKHAQLKDRALQDTWNQLSKEPDQSVYHSLYKVKEILGLPVIKQAAHSRSYRILLAVACLSFPLLIGLFIYMNHRIDSHFLVEVTVPNGKQEELRLPDGSHVWLNAGSTLRYARRFDGDSRDIYLMGEACFAVKKNTKQPFVVITEYLSVKALGTEFNVRAYADEKQVTATLNSGKVQIRLPATTEEEELTYTLRPDQQFVYKQGGQIAISDVTASDASAWKEGVLLFNNVQMPEAIQLLQHRFDIQVYYDPKRMDSSYYYARFGKNATLEQVLDVLQEIGDFTYRIDGKKVSIQMKSN